jgi:hypothetical protein
LAFSLNDKGWMSGAPLKDWMGVTVDGESGRVTEVNLREKGLVGPVPRALADLSSLEALDLIRNNLFLLPLLVSDEVARHIL